MEPAFINELIAQQSELQQNLIDRDVSEFVIKKIQALLSTTVPHDLCPESRSIVDRFLRLDHFMNRDAAATLLYWLDSRDGLSALGRIDTKGIPNPTVVGAATLSWIGTQAALEILEAAALHPTFSGFVAACALDLQTKKNGNELLFLEQHPTFDLTTVAGGNQKSAIRRTKRFLADCLVEVKKSYGTLRDKHGV